MATGGTLSGRASPPGPASHPTRPPPPGPSAVPGGARGPSRTEPALSVTESSLIEATAAHGVAGPGDAAREAERLVRFSGPPDAFLLQLLAAQCRFAGADAGAVLRVGENGELSCLASVPAPGHDPADADADGAGGAGGWLGEVGGFLAEHAGGGRGPAGARSFPLLQSDGLYDPSARRHAVVVPTGGFASLNAVAAFHLADASREEAEAVARRLAYTLALLTLYETRQALHARESELRGLALATGTLAALNRTARFGSAGLAFCNELASRFEAERVSVGVIRGRYVKLRAMSQTEHVHRKMAVVQAIEAAMEECLDQDVEVQHPAAPEEPVVARAAAELARREKCDAVLSLPLRRGGEPEAVVTLERTGRPLDAAEATFLRLACELCGPRLLEMEAADRWFGARAAASVRRGLSLAVGPTHTWAKAAALALLAAVLAVTLIEVPFRVDAPFELQAVTRRQVPAPFEGYLASVAVAGGDRVEAGEVLGELDTSELQLERARTEAERLTHQKEADEARREGKTVDVQIAEARAEEAQVQVELLGHQIAQATLRAPVAGSVISEDLQQKLFSPVKRGELLFEVARLGRQRAEMRVLDEDIPWIREGMTGSLAPASAPGDPVPFTVERVDPIAEVVNGENVFRVRLTLDERRSWFRPGVAGVAKVDVGRESILWVYTREAVNFVRLKLWL